MSRSSTFRTRAREPLADHPEIQLLDDKILGPLGAFNPTRARFDLAPTEAPPVSGPANHQYLTPPKSGDAQLEWRARDNRKGRHALILPFGHDTKADGPQPTNTISGIAKGVWRMFTVYAWWDVSWWIAVLFTWGSAIFIMSGFFYWLPLADPSSGFSNEGLAGGLTAFIGATMFTVGGVLLVVEACNENQTGCFGWALEQAFTHDSDSDNKTDGSAKKGGSVLRPGNCDHHHVKGVHRKEHLKSQHPDMDRNWEWLPTWHEMRTHYFFELGWWASITEAVGAVIFYVSGIMAIPQIYAACSQGVLYGVYWLAYLVGGILFVVASALYVLETQQKWYLPAPHLLGWWIGVWNLVGSIGWTMSASFGYCSAHWCEYQSDLSLLWASVCFFVGSALLWYEALDKYPVEKASK